MTKEEFDSTNFHKGMKVKYINPNELNPLAITEADVDLVDFNSDYGGGGIRFNTLFGYEFIHYSRIVSIK